jgi:hypothetical protein
MNPVELDRRPGTEDRRTPRLPVPPSALISPVYPASADYGSCPVLVRYSEASRSSASPVSRLTVQSLIAFAPRLP